MKIAKRALDNLIKEAIKDSRILAERPWSVEYTFSLSGDYADDSEGSSADGFSITLKSETGTVLKVIIDSYWNPQGGDESGNSIKVEVNGEQLEDGYSHVPHKFDNGKNQRIVISNSPVNGIITVAHGIDATSVPIVYLAISNPFSDDDDISFAVDPIGNSDLDIEMTDNVNI